MAFYPVLVDINKKLKELARTVMPELKIEVGAHFLSKTGNGKVIWSYDNADIEMGPSQGGQETSRAKRVAYRKLNATAEIRVKEPTTGLGEADYEKAEEMIRLLLICIDEICPADVTKITEDWTQVTDNITNGGLTVRVSFEFNLSVYGIPYSYATIEGIETTPELNPSEGIL